MERGYHIYGGKGGGARLGGIKGKYKGGGGGV